MASFFPEIRKNFGFGCMRLPEKAGVIDIDECCRMCDFFLEQGFNYFDTAHGYHAGRSETSIREFLTKRHPRESFLLTNKLTEEYFRKNEDIRPFFKMQLEACGVEYFDFYLMHAQNKQNFQKYKACRAYEEALKLKEEGLIRHFGISFHDKAEVLDQILTEYPQVEIVQIQINYVDYGDASVDARRVYEVCEKHGKPVIAMEPVKGGSLVNLPKEANDIFDSLTPAGETRPSNASYAIRFAADFPNMVMVLSGMSDMHQMEDNLSYMKDFKPLSSKERDAIFKVCELFRAQNLIPCTSCRYCIDENHCPKDILIPDMFSLVNSHKQFASWNQGYYYETVLTEGGHSKASECIGCGKCERVCPQHLEIRDLLKTVAKTFE